MDPDTHLVWYVAYGSNLASERLRYYLVGGRPDGAMRTYEGARNRSEPLQSRPVELPGGIFFAGRSLAWGGGMAFYDPRALGRVAARGYLLEAGQVNDLIAQEIRRPPGTDLNLLAPRANTSRQLGGTAYDVALRLEDLEDHPAVTITTSRSQEPAAPSPAYLHWICRGLQETFDWAQTQVADYLGQFPGVRGNWAAEELIHLAGDVDRDA